jgi:hypothetical protein
MNTTETHRPTVTLDMAKVAAMLGINGTISDVWTTDYDSKITFEIDPAGTSD